MPASIQYSAARGASSVAGSSRAFDFQPAHEAHRCASPRNVMSVDVEDWFQVAAFAGVIERDSWQRREWRVQSNVERILDMFAANAVQATFFTLGCIAERYPQLMRRIAAAGHEIASHGWEHVRVVEQDRETFRQDVLRTKGVLEDTSGMAVLGYRAASYSIGRDNLWALEVLQETGHSYSSSIYPIRHDLYGMPEAPRFAFRAGAGGLLEIPVTTVQLGSARLPCGGGGFFRLFPYAFSRWALRSVNERDGQPGVFYFHPWEIDPRQPRVADAPLKSKFRHYLALDRMEARLKRMLADFKWGRMDDVFSIRTR